jgi:hypothetical protein
MGPSVSDADEPDGLDSEADGLLDETDQELLADLARLYELIDPVPPGFVESVGFALALEHMEVELARLVSDSIEPAGTRGEERARTVTFAAENLAAMVTITQVGACRHRMDGWLAPGGGMHVELRFQGASVDTHADTDGRFEFDQVPSGLAQLVFHPTEGGQALLLTPVVTPAIAL